MPDIQLLLRPVPRQVIPGRRKRGYRRYALHNNDSRNDEQLVDISTYNIAGQSYYSRPNGATGEAVEGVGPTIRVRKSIAERLALINDALQQSSALTQLFGGTLELYVDEGFRSQEMQRRLYEDVFPALIRNQFPDLNEKEVYARRDNMIAKPTVGLLSPSPHSTGGAVDIKIRYLQKTKQFVPNVDIPMGYADTDMGSTAQPDYYELKAAMAEKDKIARRNRRIFYWLMTGVLCGSKSHMCVNPTEWWHWSYGDQMWAALTEAPHAFYGSVFDKTKL